MNVTQHHTQDSERSTVIAPIRASTANVTPHNFERLTFIAPIRATTANVTQHHTQDFKRLTVIAPLLGLMCY